MTYEPKPGNVADRVLAHMELLHKGSEISTSMLAQQTGVDVMTINSCMVPARRARAIFCRQKGGHPRSPLFWSLVDHSAKDESARAAQHAGDGSQTPNGDGPRSCTAPAKAGSDERPGSATRRSEAAPAAQPSTDGEDLPTTPKDGGRAWHLPFGAMKRAELEPEPLLVGGFAPAAEAQACRPEDRAMLATPAGAELVKHAIAKLKAEPEPQLGVSRISLTIEVATLHQAERVLQVVREMGR